MQETITFIDINELSRRLSVPEGTLYYWVQLRRIPFIKAGRSLRFDAIAAKACLPCWEPAGNAKRQPLP
jgi:excisionase family DNA binding protein